MAPTPTIATQTRQLFISDGTVGAGRFIFACFITNYQKTENRAAQSRQVRDCDTPAAAPTTVRIPGAYSATLTLTGVATPKNARYKALIDAVRSGARLEFQDKKDLPNADGGGADTFFGYVTAATEEMPVEGFVSHNFTIEVDGAMTWVAAA